MIIVSNTNLKKKLIKTTFGCFFSKNDIKKGFPYWRTLEEEQKAVNL
jgi:hypothetical protein